MVARVWLLLGAKRATFQASAGRADRPMPGVPPGRVRPGRGMIDGARPRVRQGGTDAGTVRIGALCWNQYTDWAALLAAGVRADRLGYDTLWT